VKQDGAQFGVASEAVGDGAGGVESRASSPPLTATAASENSPVQESKTPRVEGGNLYDCSFVLLG